MHRLKIYLPARIASSRLHGASTIGRLVLLGQFMGLPAPCGSSPAAPTRTLIPTMSRTGHGNLNFIGQPPRRWPGLIQLHINESQSKTSLHRAPDLYVRGKCFLPATRGAQTLPSSRCGCRRYMAQPTKCRDCLLGVIRSKTGTTDTEAARQYLPLEVHVALWLLLVAPTLGWCTTVLCLAKHTLGGSMLTKVVLLPCLVLNENTSMMCVGVV